MTMFADEMEKTDAGLGRNDRRRALVNRLFLSCQVVGMVPPWY